MRDRRGAKKRRAIPKIEAIHERDPPFNSAITLDQKQPGTTRRAAWQISQSTWLLDPNSWCALSCTMVRATLSFLGPHWLASRHQFTIGIDQE
jgi:hypothetical protein